MKIDWKFIGDVSHDDLTDLQGGADGARYHLTEDEYSKFTDLSGSAMCMVCIPITGDSDINVTLPAGFSPFMYFARIESTATPSKVLDTNVFMFDDDGFSEYLQMSGDVDTGASLSLSKSDLRKLSNIYGVSALFVFNKVI